MLAAEYILIDISLISYSPICTNITELWNIPSAFYLYPATVPGNSNTDYQHSRKPWTLCAILYAANYYFNNDLCNIFHLRQHQPKEFSGKIKSNHRNELGASR